MLGEAILDLRLIDPDRDRDRAYSLEIDRDLFGDFTVTIAHGRHGAWSRSRRIAVGDPHLALALVERRLRRRSTARRRLGAAYELVYAAGGELASAAVAAWQRLGGADRRECAERRRAIAGGRRRERAATAPALPLFGA